MIDEETIAYICEWSESGNEARCRGVPCALDEAGLLEHVRWCGPEAEFLRLNSAGLTIASLAKQRAVAWGEREAAIRAHNELRAELKDLGELLAVSLGAHPALTYRSKNDET